MMYAIRIDGKGWRAIHGPEDLLDGEELSTERPEDPDPAPDDRRMIQDQIHLLEQSVTGRRLREAVLGMDGGWLKDVDGRIKDLRESLRGIGG